MNLKNFHRKRVIVLTTTTLYKIVQSELYSLGHDHEIVDKEGNLVFFDNKFQVMSKIMSYDEDIKKIVNHLFNGYGLEKEEHDTHFKKMFFYRFINREINRQTVESFMFELMSTFMINQGHINRVYNDLEKYILQHSTSENTNKQLSKEISQQINQQVATQIDERLNSENSKSGNTQNTDNTSKDNSIQNTTNNTTDVSTGQTSSTSNQDTTQDTTQTVTGNTTSDNRQARSDLPQNRVNLDVNNTLMASANENEISRNKQTNTQDTDTNVTGNTKDTSSGTSENNSTSKVIGNSDTKNTGESNTITTGSNQSESNGESSGRTESDSHGQTDGTSDSESTGESSTLNMIYQLDELFKSSSVMEHIMNEFDKKCFLQFW